MEQIELVPTCHIQSVPLIKKKKKKDKYHPCNADAETICAGTVLKILDYLVMRYGLRLRH